MTLTARQKLAGAALLAATLPVLPLLAGASAATTARVALVVAAVLGLGAWLLRARRSSGPGAFRRAPRLTVVQRVGLSGRSGLTLIEVDGRPWLVAHGDGFARLHPVRRPRRLASPRAELESPCATSSSPVVPS